MTIRAKMTVLFIIVLIVVLGLNFAVFFFIGEKVARETARDDVKEMVSKNSGEVRFKRGKMPASSEEQTSYYAVEYGDGYLEVDDFLDLISGVACGIYSSDGTLLYGLNLLPNETKGMEFQDDEVNSVEAGKDTFYIYDRVIHFDGKNDVWIRGMIDRAQDRDQIYNMYRSYSLVLPVIVILAAIIAYLIALRALSPLNSIINEVSRINRESDLKKRVDVKAGEYEVKVIVEALNNMLSRLEKSYDQGRQFTSNVSHDLRTPMAVISAETELALEEDISDEVREAFESIQRQCKRSTDILDSLLTYMRLENDSLRYEMREVDISEITVNTCKSFQVIGREQITLDENIEDNALIKGNDSLIHALIENLLSNAFKYCDENDGEVKVSLRQDDSKVYLSIVDNGRGIAPEEQEKIFEWMYQVDETDRNKGSGIGLFIVKQIVDLHEAEIQIDSTLGKGSTFTVTFPKEGTVNGIQ